MDAPITSRTEADAPAVTVIEPRRGWHLLDVRELWRYRDLLLFLTWRDVAVRYKQTVLGVLWAILQPVLGMVVFTVFFGHVAGLSKQVEIPYPIFVYAGLLPWTLFAQAVTRSSQSLVGSARLVTKVYFPRIIIPFAATGACLVDFAVASSIIALMIAFSPAVGLSRTVLLTPVLLALTLMAALGVGTLISALNVAYRDFRHAVPFMMQLWMFATPAIYARRLPERWQWLAAINPMNALIDGWRACVLGGAIEWRAVAVSAALLSVVLIVALAYFRRAERWFADII